MYWHNVLTAVIINGNSRYGIVGVYIILADNTTLIHIITALGRSPHRKVILGGELNLNLNSVGLDRDM